LQRGDQLARSIVDALAREAQRRPKGIWSLGGVGQSQTPSRGHPGPHPAAPGPGALPELIEAGNGHVAGPARASLTIRAGEGAHPSTYPSSASAPNNLFFVKGLLAEL